MSTDPQEMHTALKLVREAATIHAQNVREKADNDYDYSAGQSFSRNQRAYAAKVNDAVGVVQTLKLDEELRLMERVADLTLEEATDLLLQVEDHIRALRRRSYPRETF